MGFSPRWSGQEGAVAERHLRKEPTVGSGSIGQPARLPKHRGTEDTEAHRGGKACLCQTSVLLRVLRAFVFEHATLSPYPTVGPQRYGVRRHPWAKAHGYGRVSLRDAGGWLGFLTAFWAAKAAGVMTQGGAWQVGVVC